MKNDSGFPLGEPKPKPFEELTFHDDFMFGIVMQDREICREVLECMLGMQIARIEYAEPQRTLDPLYTAHGVRLDVYVQDSDRVYDVEIRLPYGKHMSFRTAETHEGQTVPRPVRGVSRNVRVSERVARGRNVRDSERDTLLKGEDYGRLKESIIIFLCRFDPYKKGNSVVYCTAEMRRGRERGSRRCCHRACAELPGACESAG